MLANWIQRITICVIVPLILLDRVFSWCKINVNSLYVTYHQTITPLDLQHDASTISLTGKFLFFVLESLSSVFLFLALWYFLKLLQLFRNDVHFSQEVINTLKKINIVVLGWALYGLLFNIVASLLISLFKPAGQRYIAASVSSHDIMHFFSVLILCLIIRILQEAYRIKAEQDLVV